jgi:hypothetical protein
VVTAFLLLLSLPALAGDATIEWCHSSPPHHGYEELPHIA